MSKLLKIKAVCPFTGVIAATRSTKASYTHAVAMKLCYAKDTTVDYFMWLKKGETPVSLPNVVWSINIDTDGHLTGWKGKVAVKAGDIFFEVRDNKVFNSTGIVSYHGKMK